MSQQCGELQVACGMLLQRLFDLCPEARGAILPHCKPVNDARDALRICQDIPPMFQEHLAISSFAGHGVTKRFCKQWAHGITGAGCEAAASAPGQRL